MKRTPHNGDLDALNAGIARSRRDMATLAEGLQELARWQHAQDAADDAADATLDRGRWAGFSHGLGAAGSRGLQAARGLTGEIERHPFLAGLTAFGIGFGLATLLFKRSPGRSGA